MNFATCLRGLRAARVKDTHSLTDSGSLAEAGFMGFTTLESLDCAVSTQLSGMPHDEHPGRQVAAGNPACANPISIEIERKMSFEVVVEANDDPGRRRSGTWKR